MISSKFPAFEVFRPNSSLIYSYKSVLTNALLITSHSSMEVTMEQYVIGLDYGTNSARAVIVNANTGQEVTTHVYPYKKGEAGILLDHKRPELSRCSPVGPRDARSV